MCALRGGQVVSTSRAQLLAAFGKRFISTAFRRPFTAAATASSGRCVDHEHVLQGAGDGEFGGHRQGGRAVKAVPLPCAPTAFVAKALPLLCAPTAFVAQALPLPCVFIFFVVKTVHLSCGLQGPEQADHAN